MGARIEEKEETEDFLGYLIRNFRDKKEVIASTILISVEKGTNDIYVFDGQQRVYTIYQLLKCCEEQYDEADSQFTFVGRKNGASKYSRRAVENLRKVFDSRKKDINIREFKEFLHNKVKFKLKVTETVSDAEQFFLDINGGVSLKNYEIFKSCLCERLVHLKQTDFIKEMENTWLVWFYRFRDIKKEDETDIEELMEMRFIEFLCRFLITEDLKQMQEDNSVNNERLPAFDCMDSKSELVGKLEYLKYLRTEDVSQIRDVMNYLVSNGEEIRQPSNQLHTESYVWEDIYLGTSITANRQSIGYCLLEQTKTQKEEFIDKHKEYILQRFIDSLADEKRERLKRFYSWKDIGDLIEIYDTDLLIRDCIRRILGRKIEEGKYPYAEKKEISMIMVGGYHVGREVISGIPEEEIPAYYVAELRFVENNNYIRAKYIYDWAINANLISKSQRELYFIWTKKGKESVRKDDGEETYIVFSNRLEGCSLCEFNNTLFNEYTYTTIIQNKCRQIWLKNRTDAYFLNSEVVRELI